VGRLDRIYRLLRRRGFSDSPALSGRDAALDAGLKVLASGKAQHMSARQRAGWLWTVAKRAALRAAKSEMARAALIYDLRDAWRPAEAHHHPLATAIQVAIERLPARQRAVLTLCVLQNLSQAKAARELGIKASTVCRALKAAFAHLREGLAALAPRLLPGETLVGR
jgi:RNA polymerase sigma factor (sigma-70 family)